MKSIKANKKRLCHVLTKYITSCPNSLSGVYFSKDYDKFSLVLDKTPVFSDDIDFLYYLAEKLDVDCSCFVNENVVLFEVYPNCGYLPF